MPETLSILDRFLVEKTEEAIIDGVQLERWARDPNRKVDEELLDLDRPYKVPNKAYGYLADVEISGKTKSVIGARQEVDFGTATGPDPEGQLKRYVLGLFMQTAQWIRADDRQGGFSFEQMLYCRNDGQIGRHPVEQRSGLLDWSLIGPKYRWSLATIFLHDFVVALGPVTHQFSEAVAVVQHPDFIHIVERPAPGYKLEVAIGYPFIDYAPIPNYFGFGPGKFDWAVKLFSFLLKDNNQVKCNMDFVAGARPKKVFDFGEHVPCPLYGTATVLESLTFGLYKANGFHDWMDTGMAAQHSRVHQALMEGTSKIYREWVRSS
ncbi:MAG: hypothetical protein WCP29_07825 [Acidobacteriota bacterium]